MKKLFVTFCLVSFCLFWITISSFAQEMVVVQQSDSAIQVADKIQHDKSNDSVKLVDAYLNKYQYRQAIDLISKMKPTKELLEKKASCYASLYEYPQAVEILEMLAKKNPKDISLKLKLISIYESTQKYSKTLASYNELIELDPTNEYYKIQRANFLYSRENFNGALEQYKELCDTCDNNFLSKRLAMCYEKLKDNKSAIYFYARAWDLDTMDGYSATSLTKLLILDKQYKLAIFASNRYVAFDTTYTPMNSMNAFAYFCSDNFDEAARRFQKCMARGDSSLLVTRTLGQTHFIMERDSLANLPLQLAYDKDTMDNKVLYPLAQTYANLGNYAKAIELYKTLMKRKIPEEHELYRYYLLLGEAYYGNKEYKLAVGKLHMATQYVVEYQEKVKLHKRLAYCFDYDLKDYYPAIIHYEAYKSGLLSREISLGGVENDLSTLNLSKDTVETILGVRAEMAEIEQRIKSLQDSLKAAGGNNYKLYTHTQEALKATGKSTPNVYLKTNTTQSKDSTQLKDSTPPKAPDQSKDSTILLKE